MSFSYRKPVNESVGASLALSRKRELSFPKLAFSFGLIAILLAGSLFICGTGITQRPADPAGTTLIWQQDDDVVRVNSDLVVLNATVIDKQGQFVSGLKRPDFKVFEDGREQQLSSFSAEATPFAAAIVIDTSGSMDTRMTLARG